MKNYITSVSKWIETFYPYYMDIRDAENLDIIDKALNILFYTKLDKIEDVAIESVYLFKRNLLGSIADSGYRNTDTKITNLHKYSTPVILGRPSKPNRLKHVQDIVKYRVWCDNILSDYMFDPIDDPDSNNWEISYSESELDPISAMDEYFVCINNKIFSDMIMLKDITTVEKDYIEFDPSNIDIIQGNEYKKVCKSYNDIKETISEVKTIISTPKDNDIFKVFKEIISVKELIDIIISSCISYNNALNKYY